MCTRCCSRGSSGHSRVAGASYWVRGAIMLAAQRMLAAVRALVDAWQIERPLHVRLCAGGFSVAIRRENHGGVSFSTSTERHGPLTWPARSMSARQRCRCCA